MSLTFIEKLENYRADRSDEWTMDEFIRDAKKLQQERDELMAYCDLLSEVASREPDSQMVIVNGELVNVFDISQKQSLLLHDAQVIESAIKRAAANYYKSGDEHYGFTEGWLKSQAEFQGSQLRDQASINKLDSST